ncbi:hypothetical protein HWV62_10503 [Athelia sp. TMB]|nr:hypothetical protein HWV62_10503 [Athelia sp. TMB]
MGLWPMDTVPARESQKSMDCDGLWGVTYMGCDRFDSTDPESFQPRDDILHQEVLACLPPEPRHRAHRFHRRKIYEDKAEGGLRMLLWARYPTPHRSHAFRTTQSSAFLPHRLQSPATPRLCRDMAAVPVPTLITTLSCPGVEKAPTALDTGDNSAQRDMKDNNAQLDTGDNSAQRDTEDNNAQLDMGDNKAQASSHGDGKAIEDYGNQVPSAQAAGDVATVNSSHGDIHNDRASPSQDAEDASMETSSDAEVEAIVFRDEPDEDKLDKLQSKPDSSMSVQPKEG